MIYLPNYLRHLKLSLSVETYICNNKFIINNLIYVFKMVLVFSLQTPAEEVLGQIFQLIFLDY
jgi:hypothetical protein